MSGTVFEPRRGTNLFREIPGNEFKKCLSGPDVVMSKMLALSGWGLGFKLPFANDENKALECELEKRHFRALELKSSLEDDSEHVDKLKKHHTRIEYDNIVIQSLVTAKRAEISTEEKTGVYAERLMLKTREDRRLTQQQLEEAQQRVHTKLNDLERRKAVVMELLEISEFNEQALKKWNEHTANKEQDIQYVQKFAKMDAKNQSYFEKKEFKLTNQRRELLKVVNTISQDTIRLQDLLMRTKNEFVQVHKERQSTIKMWTRTIKALKRKELDMEIIGNDYFHVRQKLNNCNTRIWENESALSTEKRSKKQTEYSCAQIERKLRELHDKISQIQDMYANLQQEYTHFQSEVSIVTGELSNSHKQFRGFEEEMDCLMRKAACAEAEIIVLKSKHETINSHKGDSEAILKQMEMMLQEQEATCAKAEHQLKNFRHFLWERNNEKMEVEHQFKIVEKSAHKARTRLTFNISAAQREELMLQRLTGELFHVDLRCTQLQSRINRLTNEVPVPTHKSTETKLETLKDQYEKLSVDKRFIQREAKHDEVQILRLQRIISNCGEARKAQEAFLNEVILDNTKLEKSLDSSSESLKTTLVSVHLEKVLLKRLQEAINFSEESICDLSHERLSLEAAVKERRLEIDTHIAMHQNVIKTTRDTLAKLKAYLNDVLKHVSKQKIAFGNLSSLLAVRTADSTSPQSFNSFADTVLYVVQERETLSKEKQSWEDKLSEAETELVGLENNVKLIVTSNCHFKSSLSPAGEQSFEQEKVDKAEAARHAAEFRKKLATKDMLKNRERIRDLINANQILKHHLYKMSLSCDAKARLASQLTNTVMLQRDKIARWANLCLRMLSEVKSIMLRPEMQIIQVDLKLRLLQDKFEFAVLMLEKLISVFPDSKNLILDFLSSDSMLIEVGARVSHAGLRAFGFSTRTRLEGVMSTEYSNFVQELQGGLQTSEIDLGI